MKIQCPSCGFCADIDDSKIPVAGKTATCPKCRASFVISYPTSKHIQASNHSALAASNDLVGPQRKKEPAAASTSFEKIFKILLGFASAIVLSFPIAALLLYSLSIFKLLDNSGDIGEGISFLMLFAVTHTGILLYGSAMSYKNGLKLDLNCVPHVIAVMIISQAVVGGGGTFRLIYTAYAVVLLFFASFVMFLAKRFTVPLLVISSIVLLGLIYHKPVSKIFIIVKATITGHDVGYYKNIVQSLERKQAQMPPGQIMSENDWKELRRAKEKLKELQ